MPSKIPRSASPVRGAASLLVCLLALVGSSCGAPPPPPAVASDPVCGAIVNPAKALQVTYAGRTYYFDSQECVNEFWAHASAYTGVHTRHVGSR
jgi:YHS domain-containing protein